jgi:hypothetical protein
MELSAWLFGAAVFAALAGAFLIAVIVGTDQAGLRDLRNTWMGDGHKDRGDDS